MLRPRSTCFARRAWLATIALVLACSCASESSSTGGSSDGSQSTSRAQCRDDSTTGPECVEDQGCKATVPHYADGHLVAQLCPSQAVTRGLTVLDLSDDWAPRVLAGGKDGFVPYREIYTKLANEKLGDGDEWYRARHDQFYELYGIFPSLSVIAKRLAETMRHKCHDAVPNDGLGAMGRALDTWQPVMEQRSDMGYGKMIEGQLVDAARRKQLPSLDALADDPEWSDKYHKYRELEIRKLAIQQMQAHLRCEGLLKTDAMDGLLDSKTVVGMQAYHRRHMVVSWQLDNETRDTLMTDSRELDFRTLLRTLRERVVGATGVIEDGSALEQPGTVVGRLLDAGAFRADDRGDRTDGVAGEDDLPATGAPQERPGAPDWISGATDAAAQALGWWGPGQASEFLQRDERPDRIAVLLPARPAYHSSHMALRAEIDRGDVWYDYPFLPNGDRRVQPRKRKPTISLFAKHEGKEIELVRWPTTIGGWQPEVLARGGPVKLAYKESTPGPHIWRDVVALPRWIPPSSTPRRDLWRPKLHGKWGLKLDTFGPGYASAYGMVMMINHRVEKQPDGGQRLIDHGVRAHGSVSYASILDGFSHGCHRMHNHRAVRLSGFLLDHRKHEVRGPMELDYHRTFRFRRLQKTVHFESRGYRYELDPPVPVDVLEGNIRGHAKTPRAPMPLTRPMWKRYTR
jgi:hypothetical protein